MYTVHMIRTQIYIEKDAHTQLSRYAQEREKSMAEIIRDFIQQGLAKKKHEDMSGKQVLARIAGLKFKGGDTDLSANINHYLYGAPK